MSNWRARGFVIVAMLAWVCAGQAVLGADWPQWRGPGRDGLSAEKNLLKQWPEKGPPVAWEIDTVGVGYSSVAIAGGRIYTMGDLDGVEHVLCLDEADGKIVWKYAPAGDKEGYRNNRGDGPRGTPVVVGERVYCEGGNGDVVCLDAKTGNAVWRKNLVSDFGGKRPGWGYSESPLVVENMVVVTPGGGDGAIVALNKETGATLWRSKNAAQAAHYCSPQIATIAGVRQIVQMGRDSVFAVDAKNGELLWEYKGANNGTANVCMPIIEGDHVFASSAYGTGGGLVHVTRAGQKFNVKEVYFEKRMANHHGGIVKVGEHMYGFGSRDLVCMDYKSGEVKWTDRSVGKGSVIAADGMLYLLGEQHQMGLAEATPEAYKEHGRFKVENLDKPSWAHPAIANGRLYIRNQGKLTAYEIGPKQASSPRNDAVAAK